MSFLSKKAKHQQLARSCCILVPDSLGVKKKKDHNHTQRTGQLAKKNHKCNIILHLYLGLHLVSARIHSLFSNTIPRYPDIRGSQLANWSTVWRLPATQHSQLNPPRAEGAHQLKSIKSLQYTSALLSTHSPTSIILTSQAFGVLQQRNIKIKHQPTRNPPVRIYLANLAAAT